jgi:hypothetical protein
MQLVSQTEVERVLRNWQAGALTEVQVHEWAELRYAVDAYEPESAACNAVLAELDCMNMNLLTTADIPVLLEALNSPEFENILSGLDNSATIESRRRALRAHPFYAQFCG